MRIDLHRNGDVDDLGVEDIDLTVERTGDARYVFRVSGATSLELAMWTTRINRVRVQPLDDAPPWVSLEVGSAGELVSLRASACALQLEQMDRGGYFVGLYRERESWGVHLLAHGYLRARVLNYV